MAALAFGAVEFYLPPADRDAVVGEFSRTFNPPAAEEAGARPKRPSPIRVFTPRSPLFETAVNDATAAPAAPSLSFGQAVLSGRDGGAFAAERAPSAVGGWSTVVTQEPSSRRDSLAAADDGGQYALALALQKELKRVGCYGGPLHGSWSAGSKDAMGEFVKRVNAALPFDRPDDALLTLVRGQSGFVCGADCPRGQVVGRGGRCLPSTVLARDRQPPDGAATAEILAPPAPRPAPLPGRMAVGGPPPERDGGDYGVANAPAGVSAGYLDPTAATTRLEQDEPFTPPLPRAAFSPPPRPSGGSSRPARVSSQSAERRQGGVSGRLPHNQRYIPPPPDMGYRR